VREDPRAGSGDVKHAKLTACIAALDAIAAWDKELAYLSAKNSTCLHMAERARKALVDIGYRRVDGQLVTSFRPRATCDVCRGTRIVLDPNNGDREMPCPECQ
jgi:hypothetical protein